MASDPVREALRAAGKAADDKMFADDDQVYTCPAAWSSSVAAAAVAAFLRSPGMWAEMALSGPRIIADLVEEAAREAGE